MSNTGKEFGVNTGSMSMISLKGKLKELEESIQEIAKKINQQKKELSQLQTEKDTLQELIKIKNNEVRKIISQEINRVDEEMKRAFAHQKAENSRLYQQIDQFKNEKGMFNSVLAGILVK